MTSPQKVLDSDKKKEDGPSRSELGAIPMPSTNTASTPNNTPAAVGLSTTTTTATVVKKEPEAVLVPLLIGKYQEGSNDDEPSTWSGTWGMAPSDSSSLENRLTSKFEMKSSKTAADNASKKVFNGSFQMQGPKGKVKTVVEKDIELSFNNDTVTGTGSNVFGNFTLKGTFDSKTSTLTLQKLYLPKKVAKRPRASTTAATPKSNASSRSVRPRKSTPKAAAPKATVAKTKTPSATTTTTTPASATPRSKSERKRVVPSHLREDLGSISNKSGNTPSDRAMKKCLEIVKSLMTSQYAAPFLEPVDHVALNLPTYPNVIKKPMDLGTIRTNLEVNMSYEEPSQVAGHIRLTFSNAMTFNQPEHAVHAWAKKLLESFEKKYKAVEKILVSTTSTPSSNTSTAEAALTETTTAAGSESKGKKKKKRKASSTKEEMDNMRQQIEMMKAQIQQMHSASNTPTNAASTSSNTPRTPAPMTKELMNRAMTFEEKRQLSIDINRLPPGKVTKVLAIIQERVPLKPGQSQDEIEIDINAFDTPTLRELQHYVRGALATKRKRPTPKSVLNRSSSSTASYQLEIAKAHQHRTTQKIQRVKKELEKLGSTPRANTPSTTNTTLEATKTVAKAANVDDSSSSSSSSSSGSSSDSNSDSDSSEDEASHLHSATALTSAAPVLSSVNGSSTSRLASTMHLDDKSSTSPVKVENRNAWSKVVAGSSTTTNTTTTTSSLWNVAKTLEQQKKAREDSLAAQQELLVQAREKENAEKQRELERQKAAHEAARKVEVEAAAAALEAERESSRVADKTEREAQEQSVDLNHQGVSMKNMEEEFGAQGSFL